MARNKLTETRIRTLTKAGIYSDGDGLYLRVRAGGSRQWFFIYRRGKDRKEIGLGGQPPPALAALFPAAGYVAPRRAKAGKTAAFR